MKKENIISKKMILNFYTTGQEKKKEIILLKNYDSIKPLTKKEIKLLGLNSS